MLVRTVLAIVFVGPLLLGCCNGQAAEPEEYMRIHQLACQSDRTLKSIWQQSERGAEIEQHRKRDGCSRAAQAWRWRYFDEQDGKKARVLVREHSLDERLANIIYTTGTSKLFDIDAFRFNSGDAREDALNMERVAGNQVDDSLCGHQLSHMLALMRELRLKVELLRNQPAEAARVNHSSMEERHIRLAQVLDSFGRYDSNHLTGRFISIGSQEQCVRSQLLLPNKNDAERLELSNMRFCWARHKLDALLDESLRKRAKVEFEIEANVLLSGVCIPESCHSKSFAKFKDAFQELGSSEFRLPKSMYANETLEIESIFCLVDESSQYARMPLMGKLLISLLALYLLTTLLATWQASKSNKCQAKASNRDGNQVANGLPQWQALLKCLDLTESWHDFFESQPRATELKRPQRSVDLNTVNFVKVIGCAYVVFGHSLILFIGLMMDEISALQSYELNSVLLFAIAGTTAVDTFFVISGILTTFLAMLKLEKMRTKRLNEKPHREMLSYRLATGSGKAASLNCKANLEDEEQEEKKRESCTDFAKQWLFFSAIRYLRIVPMFFLFYWLKRLVLLYMGDGPMWDHGLNKDTPVGSCKREPWFVPLTPVSAYYPLTKQCIIQSWSLSTEILFSLIAPPIILLLPKRPKLIISLISIICLASMGMINKAMVQIRPELHWELFNIRGYSFTRIVNEYSYLYTSPQYRIFAIFIGCLGGYKLFLYNRQQLGHKQALRRTMFPHWFAGPATWLSTLILLANFGLLNWSRQLKHLLYPHHTLVVPLWLNWLRLGWALACLVIITRMMTDWRLSPFMRFGASKFWRVCSKLNLSILLIHFDLLAFIHLTSSRTIKSSFLQAFIEASGVYLLCLPVSMAMFVLFENPINKFINLLVFGRVK